ncbi:hypothetical protein [Mesorhizobium sp.]|uniref:hypothetical protein n=1 Tax=Mesorhizobium sp. TaxID=1871066 RepID=UPI000FE575FC|nr:hypothetical protein [Mesorhizobium sp.]RWQ57818.1 MAG: hypothetical protein EOS84_04585 [Mesorhizobium sp.]
MSKRNRDDLLELLERIVEYTEAAGGKTVTLKTGMARALLKLAKSAPKPRGRQPVTGRDRVQEAVARHIARSRKKKLIAEGMKKEAAHEQAAKEAVAKLKSRNLAESTMRRRME